MNGSGGADLSQQILIAIASIVSLGIAAEWLAWRIRLPSILVLLLFGFLAGPLSGFLNPDEVLGGMLFPVVSISIGVVTNIGRPIASQWEASAIAVEMKEFAKKQHGSAYRVDRRTG